MYKFEIPVRVQEAYEAVERLDDIPVESIDLADVDDYIDDLEEMVEKLQDLSDRLARIGGFRLCGYCRRIMPDTLAPQARYCSPSHRQRAYEKRLLG
jgi:hypothetical protein